MIQKRSPCKSKEGFYCVLGTQKKREPCGHCGSCSQYLTLLDRLIAIFDEDGGGDVDFKEYVTTLSIFSSKGNKEQRLQFLFKVYDIDRDGYISNGELFLVLKMMVGNNLKDEQLQQIVDKTIMEADLDKDGKISYEEFSRLAQSIDVGMSMTLRMCSIIPPCYYLEAIPIRKESLANIIFLDQF